MNRASRRAALTALGVLGSGLLRESLTARPDSPRFYRLGLATAATWTVGGFACGPPRFAARGRSRDALLAPLTGAVAFGVFTSGALVARRIPMLDRAIRHVLRYSRGSSMTRPLLIALVSGAAEEIFFRGPVYETAGRHPVVVSTGVYCLATTATRNPALILAAAVMGTLLGVQRRATGGIRAPILTHLTWSTLMVCGLPALFSADGGLTHVVT
ncbi:lysostaphin resistance A-like protein [Nocardia sp. NPDC051570]|uniref:lysostaphin resistance A-like protein n=1 Tax=Nocardia sp. NPDC051570 TaxID=3364324 RepID=UPI00378B13DC